MAANEPNHPASNAPAGTPGRDDAPKHRYSATYAGSLEERWQAAWEAANANRVGNPGDTGFDVDKPKFFCLDMFPYPSGAGLHVGHPEGYTATDIISRYKRMTGYNVLHPMGWDAFGLPAEQYAIQTGVHPAQTTRKAIDNFRRQLKRFGFSYDWSREISTIEPGYYRWTQWIFLQIYNAWYDKWQDKARPIGELVEGLASGAYAVGLDDEVVIAQGGTIAPAVTGVRGGIRSWGELDPAERRRFIDAQRLAYVGEQTVNWCPKLGTALANEEVIDGRSERGGFPVFRKPLRQWMFRITAFAERLLKDLALVDWPESTRTMQTEWIGRSEGAEIEFDVQGVEGGLTVFTTRPDTLFGATYMVIAPEHPMVAEAIARTNSSELSAYVQAASNRSDRERQEAKEKTGVDTGLKAVNPATGETIPVWTADYVLIGYGTGAIMAVPAHDDRDFEFATKFNLPIKDVVYTRVHHAMRHFAAHATAAERDDSIWRDILADLLGYVTTNAIEPAALGDALRIVRERRAAASEGGEATRNTCDLGTTHRRGSTQVEWLDAISAMGFTSVDEIRAVMERAGLAAHQQQAFTAPGWAAHSAGPDLTIDGRATDRAKAAVIEWLGRGGIGRKRINYKLRDWLFSRQRYWGEPFPIVYDSNGFHYPVSDKALPVELPPLTDYQPEESDEPRPLLAKAQDWVSTTAGAAGVDPALLDPSVRVARETNTMPGWAGSCWYYLRYCDPMNAERFIGPRAEKYWLGGGGVDLYIGGAEHAVLHLLYARFWHKALYDLGHVSTPEPFKKLFHQGMITSFAYQREDKSLVAIDAVREVGEPGSGSFIEIANGAPVKMITAKMSKSLKNVINPDDVIREFGADTFRLYEMYMGPLDAGKPWNPRDITGLFRFLQRAWRVCVDEESGTLKAAAAADDGLERSLHRLIAKVGPDIERLSFNTAIAAMIEFINAATSADKGQGSLTASQIERFALVLAPFAPHMAEELWMKLGGMKLGGAKPGAAGGREGFIMHAAWPAFDPAMLVDSVVEVPVQVAGKVRARISIAPDADAKAVEAVALADPKVQEHIGGKPVRKVIVIPGKMVNIVV